MAAGIAAHNALRAVSVASGMGVVKLIAHRHCALAYAIISPHVATVASQTEIRRVLRQVSSTSSGRFCRLPVPPGLTEQGRRR